MTESRVEVAADVHPPRETDSKRRWTQPRTAFDIAERSALLVAWALMIGVFSLLRPETFATSANFTTIFGSQSVLLILALALILPLVVGEFDLSIGANLGLAAVLVAVLNVKGGWSVGPAIAVALSAGLLIGLVNGFLVVILKVNALVATLGVGTLLTGLASAATDYTVIAGVDGGLVSAVTTRVLGLPVSFYLGIALAATLWYVFKYTPLGRHLLFVGAGPEVARLGGLPVTRLRVGAFAVCGLLAAFGGVVLAGTFGSADASIGNSFLLPAYAAAFLGSTTIVVGQFNAWGTVVAVYFLVTGITGLQLLGLQSWIQDVFNGGALVLAVTLARVVRSNRA